MEDFSLPWEGLLLSGDDDNLGEDHCDINESTVRREIEISTIDRPAIVVIKYPGSGSGSLVKKDASTKYGKVQGLPCRTMRYCEGRALQCRSAESRLGNQAWKPGRT